MKPYTLTNREGESISPMTSAKTVFDANGTDLETLLSEQQQAIDDGLGACAKKTEVAQGLATKQDALLDSADITVSADNELSLTEKAKKQLFIDMWNKACGTYGKYAPDEAPDALHPFLLNELWLTYDEALEVMDAGKVCSDSYSYRYTSNFKRIRTNLPPISVVSSMAMEGAFSGQKLLEVALCYNGAISVTTFHNCSKLRKIIGPLKSLGDGIHKAFGSCYALEDMEAPIIKKGTYDLADCKKISLNSLAYSVGHKTVADAVTIIVHPEVYAKLTDESNSEWHQVLTDAINNNITFATT